ncbi:MAG: DUF4383 domain-containing protein, partial [Chloroflexota bacterium]|nr:DUF4383 domain-containing protein [Chloroflexota bacterium]
MSTPTVQKITSVLGLVYLLIGVLGFIPGITRFESDPTGSVPGEGLLLGIFAVNVVHNLARRGLARATQRRAATSLRVFFRFLEQAGYLAASPAEPLVSPPRADQQPRVLTATERRYSVSGTVPLGSKGLGQACWCDLCSRGAASLVNLWRDEALDVALPWGVRSFGMGVYLHTRG